MPATAADVPNKFDVVINGEGYLHADLQEIKGEYGLNQTFVPRQNTQGDYGDNQQDFWMTATDRDWSLGEQQRFFRPSNDDSARRYWRGDGINIRDVVGQVSMEATVESQTLAAASQAVTGYSKGVFWGGGTNIYGWYSNTLNTVGAHGVGAIPTPFGLTSDGIDLYASSTSGTRVRRITVPAGAASDFSTTVASSLAFLNNTLYGYANNTGILSRYDTAGTATTLFTWKQANGTAIQRHAQILPFGGKLLILFGVDDSGTPQNGELWIYDGTAPAIAWSMPPNFRAQQAAVTNSGIVFVSGSYGIGGNYTNAAVLYYANGTPGELWRSNKPTTASNVGGGITGFRDGVVFDDRSESGSGRLMYYSPGLGGISCVATYSSTSAKTSLLAGSIDAVGMSQFSFSGGGSTAAFTWPDHSETRPSSSTVITSLFDFDSSLTKLFRGIKLEFDSATNGNGGTVDIAYRVGDVDGSYTTQTTNAASGTEYPLVGISGRSISIKVTLNKGTSTAGPVLKRVSVRAAPQVPTGPNSAGFRKFTLVLQCSGTKGNEGQMMKLRDDRFHSKSGEEMADNLFTAAASSSPISVTTELHGTISTCLIDQEGFKVQRIRKNEYIAYVPIREV